MSAGESAADDAFRRALSLEDAPSTDAASVRRVEAARGLIDAAARALRQNRSELAVLVCLAAAQGSDELDRSVEGVLSEALLRVRCLRVASDAHAGGALSVAWSPDGSMLASGGVDGCAALWSGEDLSPITRFEGHEDRIRRVEFNPAEPLISTCGDDGAARVWNVATCTPLWRAQGRDASALAAQFSPDGRRVAVAAAPEWSGLRDAWSGEELFGFARHDGVVIYDAAFSPDGRLLATCGDDGRAVVWDAGTGEVVCEVKHDRPVRSVAFSRAGGRLATACYDGSVAVTRLSDGRRIELASPSGRAGRARFVGDDDLWIVGDGGAQMIWTDVDGEPRAIALPEHEGQIVETSISNEAGVLASVGRDGAARVVALADGDARLRAELHSAGGPTWDVDLTRLGDRAATADADGSVRVWSLRDESLTAQGMSGETLLRAARKWRRASGRRLARAELELLAIDADVGDLD